MSPSFRQSYIKLKSNTDDWQYDLTPYVKSITTSLNTMNWSTTYTTSTQTATTTGDTWYVLSPSYTQTPGPNPMQARRPAPREFNRYLNASDLLEEFIAWLGTEGVRSGEVMDLPIELFVKWVIVRACEADDEEPNVELVVPRRPQPRCLGCQRFMARRTRVPLHGPRCAERHFARVAA